MPIPFSVYGLGPAYLGERNLVMWNQPDYLWTVTLAHEADPPGRSILVGTIRKEPNPKSLANTYPTEPVGIESAALSGVIMAVDSSSHGLTPAQREQLIDDEIGLIDIDDGADALRHWDDTEILIDGLARPSYTREVASTVLVAVDLAEVVVSVAAPSDFDMSQLDLRDVRDHLADYPWPSIRERMRSRRDPPLPPKRKDLAPLYVYLRDVLANAKDGDADPTELLARIEHITDHLLHDVLSALDKP